MDNRQGREILAAHAGQLDESPSLLTQNDRVKGLLDLAEQLSGILVPVQPDPDFRRRLHGDLILKAQSRQIEPEPGLFQQHRKGILIGAAALGSVASVLGVIIAFVLHNRHGRARVAAG